MGLYIQEKASKLLAPSSVNMFPPRRNMFLLLHIQRLNVPYALRVLLDTPVAAKKAHPGHAGDALGRPAILVAEGLVNELLRLAVGAEIIADEVVVAVVDDSVDEGRERGRVPIEHVAPNSFENLFQVWVEGMFAVEMGVAKFFDVFG